MEDLFEEGEVTLTNIYSGAEQVVTGVSLSHGAVQITIGDKQYNLNQVTAVSPPPTPVAKSAVITQ